MKKILLCWLGWTDLRARREPEQVGLGPIGEAVRSREFDLVVLLNNYPVEETEGYSPWLQRLTQAEINLHHQKLSSPTHFGEIYQAAVNIIIELIKKYGKDSSFTFHLSPGTPAMAAVWIILAKTRFPAELIESSKEHGVSTASVPFDISAEFIPDLLRQPDRELERLSAGLPPEAPEFSDIIHQSTVMQRVIAKARLVAPRSVPVLIEGESGTGKELLARAIHRASPRRAKPFIAVNCGAIPVELLESELFGHEKGAFTGAERACKGYFEEAEGGTLFLDEIGELSALAQVKLLRVLQESEIVRLGSRKPIRVNVRIVTATNRNLMNEVAAGKFRSDLFYRLAVAIIQLPPLRERPGDLTLLIDQLLEKINADSSSEPGYHRKKILPAAKNLLLQHRWPGNIRELLNTLFRAAIWTSKDSIGLDDIREAMLPEQAIPGDGILHRPLGESLHLPELMNQVARHYLQRAMTEAHGNKTVAAKLVGLPSYQTLTNWMVKYGIEK
ncbi:MAG: sigma 54-interacting transcriptional regulator [Desulfobacca sp.]|nr:sigma 54-interacting transcriptional regulator [Desulfobacca sp.]